MSQGSQRWLTSELPGAGGTFAPSPEDFFVEELALYEPVDEGEHLYVRVEKRGLTTREVLARARDVWGVAETDVGYAGLKDKHATTAQTISVRGVAPDDAPKLEREGLRVLWARRHRNKLRVGHLAGNRFRVVLRAADEGAEARARDILRALESRGLPNFFGEQRFGVEGGNVADGRDVLRRGGRGVPHWKARFVLSALQSALFNDVLARRMSSGDLERVRQGDLLQKVESGGVFECADPAADQARYDAFEVSITGPIFGAEMRAPTGEPAALEAAVLSDAGLSIDDFGKVVRLAPGTRRALRVRIREASVAADGGTLVLSFALPAGAYATVLVEEVMKSEARAARDNS